MGCHQLIPGQKTSLMAMARYQEPDGQEQLPPKLLTEGARVDPEWLLHFLTNPSLSTTDTNRNGVRPYLQVRMPTFSFSENELGKLVRFFQALSASPSRIFRSSPGACIAKETEMARSFSAVRCTLPEMPRDGRSRPRSYCNRAQLLAGQRPPEARLGGALDHRPASHQPGHIDALRLFQARECRWVFSAHAGFVPGLR